MSGGTAFNGVVKAAAEPRIISASDSPVFAAHGDELLVRTATGAVTVYCEVGAVVYIADIDGSAATYNITVTAPGGHTIMDGAVDETFLIDLAFFSATFRNRPGGANWSVE